MHGGFLVALVVMGNLVKCGTDLQHCDPGLWDGPNPATIQHTMFPMERDASRSCQLQITSARTQHTSAAHHV